MSDALPELIRSNPPARTSWLGAILSLVIGLIITAAVGVAGYFYIVSRLHVMILLAIIVEASLTGLVLAWLYRWTSVRSLIASVLIAAVCGLLGGLYCQYSFYVREALNFHDRNAAADRDALRKTLPLLVKPGTPEYAPALANLDKTPPRGGDNPIEEFDRLRVFPITHHHRFVGYVIQLGVFGVVLLVFHLGLVMFLAVQIGWAEPRLRAKASAGLTPPPR